jgi:regulator of cell morphogenesis and NO signaling
MDITATAVAEIGAGSLAAVRVFKKFGIDYCCGGKYPLEDTCRNHGHDLECVRRELDTALADGNTPERDWNTAPLADLIAHIIAAHHEYLRRELPALQARLDKVDHVYNERYGPTLRELPEVFTGLRAELEMHIRKEMVLFPAIAACEAAVNASLPLPPAPFGTVANPLRTMEAEHESAGHALSRIREIASDYAQPEHACVRYRALMRGLEEIERYLQMHIHLENTVLFQRAYRLEIAGSQFA